MSTHGQVPPRPECGNSGHLRPQRNDAVASISDAVMTKRMVGNVTTIINATKRGLLHIPAQTVGGNRLYPEEEAKRFLAAYFKDIAGTRKERQEYYNKHLPEDGE